MVTAFSAFKHRHAQTRMRTHAMADSAQAALWFWLPALTVLPFHPWIMVPRVWALALAPVLALAQDMGARVVNGDNADQCEYPWQVSLQSGRHECGGSLVAPTWVVTAAHCLAPRMKLVVVGDHIIDSTRDDGNHKKAIKIKKQIPHPDYHPNTNEHDIALLELEEEVTPNRCVKFVALPTAAVSANKQCQISGWGSLQYQGRYPSTLQEATVKIIDHHQCNGRTSYNGDLTGDMICAQGKNAQGKIVDACQGDSGGPLVCKEGDKWVLHGATSWGNGCAHAKYPGIWSSVYVHRQWLDTFLGKDGTGSPECKDTDNGAKDRDLDDCADYTTSGHTDWCGHYDDRDFRANEMCCACGGGSTGQCRNTDRGKTDQDGDSCEDYVGNERWCGKYDDADFKSKEMCCACGGGRGGATTRLFEDFAAPAAPAGRAQRLGAALAAALGAAALAGLATALAWQGARQRGPACRVAVPASAEEECGAGEPLQAA